MATPLLCDDLQLVEKVTLSSLVQQPGYSVLTKIMEAACSRATEDVIKLDPTEKGYTQKLIALQSRARHINEFSSLVLKSINWHVADSKIKQK